jgi:hypothetical protein
MLKKFIDTLREQRTVHGEASGSIAFWMKNFNNFVTNNRSLSNNEQLCRFIDSITMRAQSGDRYQVLAKLTKSRQKEITRLSKRDFEKEFRLGGKRFPADDSLVAISVISVLEKHFNGKLMNYVDHAQKHAENGFLDDPHILPISKVGIKTRNLALRDFSGAFLAPDIHIKRIIPRIGLSALAPRYGLDLNFVDDVDAVFSIFAHRIAKDGMKISAGELDQALWRFGNAICGKIPKCSQCKLAKNRLCSFKEGRMLYS